MTIVQRLKDAKAAFQKEAKEELAKTFKEFFEAHPEVDLVRWDQYTPYFNDGETCYFGVREVEGFREDGADIFDFCKETEEQWNYVTRTTVPALRAATEAEERLSKDFGALTGLVEGLEELLEGIFGDHCTVTATKNGFEVEDCEHD